MQTQTGWFAELMSDDRATISTAEAGAWARLNKTTIILTKQDMCVDFKILDLIYTNYFVQN